MSQKIFSGEQLDWVGISGDEMRMRVRQSTNRRKDTTFISINRVKEYQWHVVCRGHRTPHDSSQTGKEQPLLVTFIWLSLELSEVGTKLGARIFQALSTLQLEPLP